MNESGQKCGHDDGHRLVLPLSISCLAGKVATEPHDIKMTPMAVRVEVGGTVMLARGRVERGRRASRGADERQQIGPRASGVATAQGAFSWVW